MSDEMEPTDEISLRAYAETLSRYRRVIGAVVGGVMALFVLGALVALLYLPSERLGVLQFRLLFDGASLNEYPDGTAFSPTEIVSAPVLTAVYEANDSR